MATNPTVSDLWKTAVVTDQEIDVAVEAYLANPNVEPFRFACGHAIDVAAAVDAHQPSKVAIADDDWTPGYKRLIIRTAILLAHPVKG